MNDQYLSYKHIKAMGWISIIISILGALVFLYSVLEGTVSFLGALPVLLLSLFGIYAGNETLKNTRKGKKLLSIFFAIQIVSVITPTFYIILNVGLSLGFHFTAGASKVSINVIAFIMFLICLRMLREHKHITQKKSDVAA